MKRENSGACAVVAPYNESDLGARSQRRSDTRQDATLNHTSRNCSSRQGPRVACEWWTSARHYVRSRAKRYGTREFITCCIAENAFIDVALLKVSNQKYLLSTLQSAYSVLMGATVAVERQRDRESGGWKGIEMRSSNDGVHAD